MRHLINRAVHLPLFFIVFFILCGCTANVSTIDENGLSPHLTVDLHIPENIGINVITTLSVNVQKSKQPFEQAEEAVFSIWLEDNPEEKVYISAVHYAPGIYEVEHAFPTEGIYIIQSHVIASDMEVMPSKRVAIGKEAIEHLAHLEQEKNNNSISTVHHNHH